MFKLDPNLALQVGAGLLGGNTVGQQLGGVATNLAQYNATAAEKAKLEAEKQQMLAEQNKTAAWLQQNDPEAFQYYQAGMPVKDALGIAVKKRQQAQQPARLPGSYEEFKLAQANPAYAEHLKGKQRPLVTINDEMSQRKLAAEQNGLTPGDPAYQSFVLTGKLPREDQAPLTATDKKAILEADEMVAVNRGAIDALTEAKRLSSQANQGWLSGARATIGNNLPDRLVPDRISSPESSAATTNFDNAVIGQALTQLKAIFGGAPTEGERKILLDLQGSSNLPKDVREGIIDRAIKAAERRLEFNATRAGELRNQEFYKSKQPQIQPSTGTKTSTGITYSVETP